MGGYHYALCNILDDLKRLGVQLIEQLEAVKPEMFIELPDGEQMLRKYYKAPVVPLTPPTS
jgi:hypothetical protein